MKRFCSPCFGYRKLNRDALQYAQNLSMKLRIGTAHQTGSPHQIFTYAIEVRENSAGFFDTRNQRCNIPRIHFRVDGDIDASLGHQRMLDAIADESKLARHSNQLGHLADMAREGRINV